MLTIVSEPTPKTIPCGVNAGSSQGGDFSGSSVSPISQTAVPNSPVASGGDECVDLSLGN